MGGTKYIEFKKRSRDYKVMHITDKTSNDIFKKRLRYYQLSILRLIQQYSSWDIEPTKLKAKNVQRKNATNTTVIIVLNDFKLYNMKNKTIVQNTQYHKPDHCIILKIDR
jgi:hypothetical protein